MSSRSGKAGSEMRAVLVAIAILAASACDRSTAPAEAPPPSATPVADSATDTPPTPSFTDRVWLRADAGSPPGAMQVYLSDGTLISDSCFETYRLSNWRLEGEELVWSEDAIDIRARLVSVDSNTLVLRVMLRGGEEEQRFTEATVPYVCPDMPR